MTLDELARTYTNLGRAIQRFPNANWTDALAHGQLQSKSWAVQQLGDAKRNVGLVYVLGGWLGMLGPLLFADPRLKIKKIRSFDIDPNCEPIADQINIEHVITEWRYKAVTKNMFDIDYNNHAYAIPIPGGYVDEKTKKFVHNKPAQIVEAPDTIINTSCDHIADFGKWWSMIPKGKLVLLQNNNFKAGGDDHVNTVGSLDEFSAQAPMSKILFAGERKFSKYDRFMLIGVK